MTYAIATDVRAVMRKLPSSITDAEITPFLNKADALIDAMLGEVFVTPFTSPPKIINMIATDLASFFLAEALFGSQAPNQIDSSYDKRYERAMKMLLQLSAGDLVIGLPKINTSEAGFASTNEEDAIFTLNDPEW